jgi:flavin reductase (DIM6/NTAB) family NADH-FMN oxidoreductase RutF
VGTLIARPNRDALRLILAGPVTLISSMQRGQPNVMTAAWHMPVSLAPTLIAVAVQPTRLTHSFISASEQFVVNIPTVDLIGPVHQAGMITGRDIDKFATIGLEPEESSVVEAPRVVGCAAYIECQVRDRATMGDHDLFVADIVSVLADDESFDGHWNVESDAGRLLHHLGADRYAELARSYRARLPEDEEETRSG